MQNVGARWQGELEVPFFVRLDLCDSFPFEAVDCQRGLIRLVGAFLSDLHDRTLRTHEHLSFDTACGVSGFLKGAGGEQDDH